MDGQHTPAAHFSYTINEFLWIFFNNVCILISMIFQVETKATVENDFCCYSNSSQVYDLDWMLYHWATETCDSLGHYTKCRLMTNILHTAWVWMLMDGICTLMEMWWYVFWSLHSEYRWQGQFFSQCLNVSKKKISK